jgi:hypothetical protein
VTSLRTALQLRALLALGIFSCPPVLADVPAPTEATTSEVKTLLHLNGSEDTAAQLGRVIGQGVIAELRRTIPNLPAHAETRRWEENSVV